VDEAQDLDRTQLELALLLAAPSNDVFLVGDDDQTVYSWRLADVRRVLGLAASLPGLRRVDLETNYRCPPPVVARAVRLVEHNRERFAKRILAGSRAGGRLVLAPDTADDVVRVRRAMASWPADGTTRAVLARTNRELLVAVVAALDLGVPFRAPDLPLAIEDPRTD
jgi:DNA helicase-2/ATP-dependent DNA helicase PcrA